MRTILILAVTAMLALAGCSSEGTQAPLSSQSAEGANTGAEAEFDALLGQISKMDEQGGDVPEEVYDRYFELEEQLHPEFYSLRGESPGALDELEDTCPGTDIYITEETELLVQTNCGQTHAATNNCTYPNCRYGRDVMVRLIVEEANVVLITTTGSRFDTYLCIFNDGCCGQGESYKMQENNNNPALCNGQRLAAGLEIYLVPGWYNIVLDGAGPAAFGSYCLTIETGEI